MENDKVTEEGCFGSSCDPNENLVVQEPEEKRFKGIVVSNNYKILDAYKDIKLPPQVYIMYGCMNCEWRGTPLCPFSFEKGKGYYNKKNTHSDGICNFRRNYLRSFSRDNKKPSFAKWQADFNKGIMQAQSNKEFFKLQQVEHDLDNLNTEDPLEKKYLEDRKDKLREQWFQLASTILKWEDKQVDRETPKTVNINNASVSVSQFQNMVNGINEEDIIDAEYDDIDEL